MVYYFALQEATASKSSVSSVGATNGRCLVLTLGKALICPPGSLFALTFEANTLSMASKAKLLNEKTLAVSYPTLPRKDAPESP